MQKSYLLSLLLILLLASSLTAQKQDRYQHLEIKPDTEEQSDFTGSMRVSKETGVPLAIYNLNYRVSGGSPEQMAREYLQNNYSQLKLNQDLTDLKFLSSTQSAAGHHVRFQQYYKGYPVYQATIVVSISKDNRIYFVMNSYKPDVQIKGAPIFNASINVSETQALASAKNYLNINGRVQLEKVEPVVFYNKGVFRLAQKVVIVPSEEVYGDWEVMIDAATGEIFRVEDKSCKLHNHKPAEVTANGTGWVFAPNPITRARTTYGQPGFVDGNDADTDSLTAQLVQVVLKNIDFHSGTGKYTLKSSWAEILDFESPYTGLHQLDSSKFHFKRFHDHFEAVNTFHSIVAVMEWLNDSLGLVIRPYQYTGGVQFDPHGLNGDDNSHYITSTGRVAFGDGGVDDAEDPFVIVHELGHGLHDWATSGGLSQVQGLSEGCGDYMGMSYERSFGCLPPNHPSYNFAFNWDGHNPFWAGRVTNYAPLYPGGLVGQIHTDGQMWASTLMTIYDQIGRSVTDKNFITALTMLNSGSNQRDAALAFMAADQQLYGGSHLQVIGAAFQARGYIGPITADFTANITGGQAPLTVQFTDMSTGTSPITSWAWDFNNDGTVDATTQNASWTYNVPGVYSVKLTVSDGTNSMSKLKTDYISVNSGVLVWEGSAGAPNYSGVFIRDYMIANNYEVNYSTSFPSSFLGYEAIFLSFGNYGSGGTTRTQFTATMAAAVKSYLEAGGRVYLEGGEALGYDQASNTALLSLFGLASATDGSTQVITALTGQSGTVTQGMLFTSSTQPQNAYIDKYTPGGTGLLAFVNGTYGNVAVQNTGAAGHRTFCFSYALSHLVDASAPSLRAEILARLLNFFEILPVPVELVSFNAALNNGAVTLNWETASEVNNMGFAVERMEKGSSSNFSTINFVEGKGTTTSKSIYSFTDKPLPGIYVYRLRQTDFDGSISYSNEVEIDLNTPQTYSLEQNYPNPFNPSTTISYSIEKDGFVYLSVYNTLGEKVAVLVNGVSHAGKYQVTFDASSFTSGVYFYRLESEGFTSVKKMIISK